MHLFCINTWIKIIVNIFNWTNYLLKLTAVFILIELLSIIIIGINVILFLFYLKINKMSPFSTDKEIHMGL